MSQHQPQLTHSSGKPRSSSRLGYLDWTRGIAATIMLQGHCFHSFTANNLREQSPYVMSQFVGGMPPAIFLFLTGVTLAFLMDSNERKGLTSRQKITTALRRSGYLFALAYGFRLQQWLFALPGSLDRPMDFWKVDILNCMGFAIAVVAVMSLFTTADRIRNCAILGLAIACAAPLVASLDWSHAPMLVRLYLVPDANYFAFFPWASFLVFGVSAGSILRVARPEHTERLMQWSAIAGFGLVFGAQYLSNLPYNLYEKSDFWLNGPTLILIKLGVILLLVSFAWVWHTHVVKNSWSWVAQLGTTSLLVYWAHTELVYGRWFWMWKEALPTAAVIAIAVTVILMMIGLSTLKTRWQQVRTVLPYYRRQAA